MRDDCTHERLNLDSESKETAEKILEVVDNYGVISRMYSQLCKVFNWNIIAEKYNVFYKS